jgi:hypothetical protein
LLQVWGEEVVGRDVGGNRTNVQCKVIGILHSVVPLYNEYMLIKMKKAVLNKNKFRMWQKKRRQFSMRTSDIEKNVTEKNSQGDVDK